MQNLVDGNGVSKFEWLWCKLPVCSSRALSRLRALFCVGAWCSDPGTHVLSYGSCWGLDTRAPSSVLCERAVSSLLGRALSCPRVLWCARSSCLYWLHAFMLCLVWTCGLWVFSLAACSCPVLHMAGDLFCWPCACVFVLCEHIAFVLVFSVSCALMLIVLTPPILLPDYCSFAHLSLFPRYPPHLLPSQSPCVCSPVPVHCRSSVVCSSCLALSCPPLPSPPLPYPVLPCQACQLSCFFSTG